MLKYEWISSSEQGGQINCASEETRKDDVLITSVSIVSLSLRADRGLITAGG
jgi:hypothetical protein